MLAGTTAQTRVARRPALRPGKGSKPFAHLVDSPRPFSGGVLFSIDGHDLERTIFVTQEALHAIDPEARSDREKLHRVMMESRVLIELALAKLLSIPVPQLVVLDVEDVKAAGAMR